MVDASFACRRGKGTHAALARAQALVRRHGWFLELDIARFFASLRHDVVLKTVARTTKDRRVLGVVEHIVRGVHPVRDGIGPPIGNLSSQWFANLVLDQLDHYVLEELRPSGYVRYMDDFVLFAAAPGKLRAAHAEIETFLADRLRLRLKSRATILAPSHAGLPFLGWRVYAGLRRLRPANLRRVRARLRHRTWEHRRGERTEDELASSLRSVFVHLRQGDTLRLRQRLADEVARHLARPP